MVAGWKVFARLILKTGAPMHYASEQPDAGTSKIAFMFMFMSLGVSERASERSGARERGEQCRAREWSVQASEQMDKPVAQYLRPDFWLI